MTIAIVQVFIHRYSIQVLVMLRTSKTPHGSSLFPSGGCNENIATGNTYSLVPAEKIQTVLSDVACLILSQFNVAGVVLD